MSFCNRNHFRFHCPLFTVIRNEEWNVEYFKVRLVWLIYSFPANKHFPFPWYFFLFFSRHFRFRHLTCNELWSFISIGHSKIVFYFFAFFPVDVPFAFNWNFDVNFCWQFFFGKSKLFKLKAMLNSSQKLRKERNKQKGKRNKTEQHRKENEMRK